MILKRKRWNVYLYILPTVLIILAVTIFPLVYSVYISLFDYLMQTRTMRFIGLGNFINLVQDMRFYQSLWITIKIGLPALTAEIVLGFGLALLLNSVRRGRGLLTSLLSTPVMIAPTAAALSFNMLYTPRWGALNHILALFTGQPVQIDWLGTNLAPFSVALTDIWQMTPFVMLITLAGLASIPDELYEAAAIDGAAGWTRFRYITLPLVRLPLGVALILRAIDLFKMFDLPFVLTHGGPAAATETITFYAYQIGVEFLRVGYGAAMALVLLWLIIFMSTRLVKYVRREESQP